MSSNINKLIKGKQQQYKSKNGKVVIGDILSVEKDNQTMNLFELCKENEYFVDQDHIGPNELIQSRNTEVIKKFQFQNELVVQPFEAWLKLQRKDPSRQRSAYFFRQQEQPNGRIKCHEENQVLASHGSHIDLSKDFILCPNCALLQYQHCIAKRNMTFCNCQRPIDPKVIDSIKKKYQDKDQPKQPQPQPEQKVYTGGNNFDIIKPRSRHSTNLNGLNMSIPTLNTVKEEVQVKQEESIPSKQEQRSTSKNHNHVENNRVNKKELIEKNPKNLTETKVVSNNKSDPYVKIESNENENKFSKNSEKQRPNDLEKSLSQFQSQMSKTNNNKKNDEEEDKLERVNLQKTHQKQNNNTKSTKERPIHSPAKKKQDEDSVEYNPDNIPAQVTSNHKIMTRSRNPNAKDKEQRQREEEELKATKRREWQMQENERKRKLKEKREREREEQERKEKEAQELAKKRTTANSNSRSVETRGKPRESNSEPEPKVTPKQPSHRTKTMKDSSEDEEDEDFNYTAYVKKIVTKPGPKMNKVRIDKDDDIDDYGRGGDLVRNSKVSSNSNPKLNSNPIGKVSSNPKSNSSRKDASVDKVTADDSNSTVEDKRGFFYKSKPNKIVSKPKDDDSYESNSDASGIDSDDDYVNPKLKHNTKEAKIKNKVDKNLQKKSKNISSLNNNKEKHFKPSSKPSHHIAQLAKLAKPPNDSPQSNNIASTTTSDNVHPAQPAPVMVKSRIIKTEPKIFSEQDFYLHQNTLLDELDNEYMNDGVEFVKSTDVQFVKEVVKFNKQGLTDEDELGFKNLNINKDTHKSKTIGNNKDIKKDNDKKTDKEKEQQKKVEKAKRKSQRLAELNRKNEQNHKNEKDENEKREQQGFELKRKRVDHISNSEYKDRFINQLINLNTHVDIQKEKTNTEFKLKYQNKSIKMNDNKIQNSETNKIESLNIDENKSKNNNNPDDEDGIDKSSVINNDVLANAKFHKEYKLKEQKLKDLDLIKTLAEIFVLGFTEFEAEELKVISDISTRSFKLGSMLLSSLQRNIENKDELKQRLRFLNFNLNQNNTTAYEMRKSVITDEINQKTDQCIIFDDEGFDIEEDGVTLNDNTKQSDSQNQDQKILIQKLVKLTNDDFSDESLKRKRQEIYNRQFRNSNSNEGKIMLKDKKGETAIDRNSQSQLKDIGMIDAFQEMQINRMESSIQQDILQAVQPQFESIVKEDADLNDPILVSFNLNKNPREYSFDHLIECFLKRVKQDQKISQVELIQNNFMDPELPTLLENNTDFHDYNKFAKNLTLISNEQIYKFYRKICNKQEQGYLDQIIPNSTELEKTKSNDMEDDNKSSLPDQLDKSSPGQNNQTSPANDQYQSKYTKDGILKSQIIDLQPDKLAELNKLQDELNQFSVNNKVIELIDMERLNDGQRDKILTRQKAYGSQASDDNFVKVQSNILSMPKSIQNQYLREERNDN